MGRSFETHSGTSDVDRVALRGDARRSMLYVTRGPFPSLYRSSSSRALLRELDNDTEYSYSDTRGPPEVVEWTPPRLFHT